jgi:ABC-type transport system substrate-binding protein
MGFNFKRTFTDNRIRQALNYAVNKELVEHVLGGAGRCRTHSPVILVTHHQTGEYRSKPRPY